MTSRRRVVAPLLTQSRRLATPFAVAPLRVSTASLSQTSQKDGRAGIESVAVVPAVSSSAEGNKAQRPVLADLGISSVAREWPKMLQPQTLLQVHTIRPEQCVPHDGIAPVPPSFHARP